MQFSFNLILTMAFLNAMVFPFGLLVFKTRYGFDDMLDIAFWTTGAFW